MKEQIIKLFQKSKNVQFFFLNLRKKENKSLYEWFQNFLKKTVYFPQFKRAKSQALYNLLNNINDFPLYSDGGLKIFKNFKSGYYSEEEYNNGEVNTHLLEIKDEKYVYPALRHLNISGVNPEKLLQKPCINSALEKLFGENYNKIPKKHIFTYVKLGVYHPLYCEVCGKLILYPNSSLHHCNKLTCKNTFDLKEEQYFDYLKNIFLNEKRSGAKIAFILKSNKKIREFLLKYLKKYFSEEIICRMSANQKVYHLIYDIHEIKKCPVCGVKNTVWKEGNNLKCYSKTCSNRCSNIFIEHINKRLLNNFSHTNIGKNENFIINELFPENNFKKGKIGAFFPDFIDFENKTIYEINEKYHLLTKKIKTDKRKYGYLNSNRMEN